MTMYKTSDTVYAEVIAELEELGFVKEILWAKHTRYSYRVQDRYVCFYWSTDYGWQFKFHIQNGFSVRVNDTEKFTRTDVRDLSSLLVLYK